MPVELRRPAVILALAGVAACLVVMAPKVLAAADAGATFRTTTSPRAAATLATREMILVNQVGFARGTARWRARELYRLMQDPVEAADVAPGDRSRAVTGAVAALRRELHEHRVLTDELGQVKADGAAQRSPPAASSPVPPASYLAPVSGGVETPFGAARDAGSGVWIFRAGVRLRARAGEMVRAPQDGTVRRAFETPHGRRAVVLAHADGQISILDGLGELRVTPGQVVRRGETLALLPESATISLEIWRGLAPLNPAGLLAPR